MHKFTAWYVVSIYIHFISEVFHLVTSAVLNDCYSEVMAYTALGD